MQPLPPHQPKFLILKEFSANGDHRSSDLFEDAVRRGSPNAEIETVSTVGGAEAMISHTPYAGIIIDENFASPGGGNTMIGRIRSGNLDVETDVHFKNTPILITGQFNPRQEVAEHKLPGVTRCDRVLENWSNKMSEFAGTCSIAEDIDPARAHITTRPLAVARGLGA